MPEDSQEEAQGLRLDQGEDQGHGRGAVREEDGKRQRPGTKGTQLLNANSYRKILGNRSGINVRDSICHFKALFGA